MKVIFKLLLSYYPVQLPVTPTDPAACAMAQRVASPGMVLNPQGVCWGGVVRGLKTLALMKALKEHILPSLLSTSGNGQHPVPGASGLGNKVSHVRVSQPWGPHHR